MPNRLSCGQSVFNDLQMAVQQTRAERPADVLIVGAEDRIRTGTGFRSQRFLSQLAETRRNERDVTAYVLASAQNNGCAEPKSFWYGSF